MKHLAKGFVLPSDRRAAALAKTKPARDALLPKQLVAPNVDYIHAANVALVALPRIEKYRPLLRATFRTFDFANLDALDELANATLEAHLSYSTVPTFDIRKIYDEALLLRQTLTSDLKTLILRKLLPRKILSKLSYRAGYQNVANDLMSISIIVDQHRAVIGRASLIEAELVRARSVIDSLVLYAGQQRQILYAADQTRRRALTLLVRAYDEVREAIAYVRRREGDAARIAPSLYAQPGSGRRKSKSIKTTATTPTATAADIATPPPRAVA